MPFGRHRALGLVEIGPAIVTFVGALAPSVVALVLAFGAFVVIWTDGLRGLGAALAAMVISGALLAYPSYLSYQAYKLPWIYDVTTDPIDPPRYEALARLRPRNANPITYAGLYAAEQQRAAYPDIEPLMEDAPPDAAYTARAGGDHQAQVDHHRPPATARQPPRRPYRGGRAYADHGLPRRRRGPGARRQDGSRIDVRSSSRYGSFDFGRNASRVRKLMDDIDDAVGDQKPAAPLPPVKKPPPPAPKKPQSADRR